MRLEAPAIIFNLAGECIAIQGTLALAKPRWGSLGVFNTNENRNITFLSERHTTVNIVRVQDPTGNWCRLNIGLGLPQK